LHRYQIQEKSMTRMFNTQRICAVVVASALLVGLGTAAAAEVKLTGAEETPPVKTAASGSASITIAADKSVTGSVSTTGIEGTVAHIHVGAPGVAGPPIITLTKGANDAWSVPAGSKLTDEQYASYKAGNLYVNVHSAAHAPGEIRAQLKP